MNNIWKYLIVGVLAFVLGSSAVVSAMVVEKRGLTNGDGTRDVAVTQKGQLAMYTQGKMRMTIANPGAIQGPTGPQGPQDSQGIQGPQGSQGPEGPPGGLGTHHFVVGGEAFGPRDDTATYSKGLGLGGAYLKSGSGGLVAPVHLPHGAVVTSVKAYFYDNLVSDISLTLDRHDLAFPIYERMAAVTLSGISANGNVTDSTISRATISNQNYSYLVTAFSNGWNGDLRIIGVVITYTVS